MPPTGRFASAAPLGYRTIAEEVSGGLVGMVGQFLVGAAGSEGPPRGRGRGRACAEYASGSEFVEVGKALSGKSVEQVGLADIELGTAEWVEWFNNQRLHSAIGDIPPHEHEANHHAQHQPQSAAEVNA
ncbi:integrase core domain-containing protein [Streptomyces sp. Wh19]|uniref:integrase core domain-containing protein n=1 Tax=Streptomyces sp. Wh19 TaxID=3076629 RepID=UPI003FA3BC39